MVQNMKKYSYEVQSNKNIPFLTFNALSLMGCKRKYKLRPWYFINSLSKNDLLFGCKLET